MLKVLKNHYVIALVILLVTLVIAFSNIVFLGKTLTSSALPAGTTRYGPYLYNVNKPLLPVVDGAASAWHWEPAMQLNNRAYLKGQLPLWNPYNGAGQPLAADMQSSSFYPLALPLILKPTPLMWDVFLLFRLLLAGFFTFMFLRLINIRMAGSIAGALTFMLSGYLMFYVNMAHLNVEILIPLMLFATELLIRKRSLWSVVLMATTSALVIVGGMPESALLNFGFAFAYLAYRLYQQHKEKHKENKQFNEIAKTAFLYFTGILTGIIISSISWAPFVEYSKVFWSNHSESGKGLAALSPRYFVQYLAPMFLGVQNAVYVGIIPLFLSIVAKKNHKYKWFFIIAALIISLKVFGLGINWLGYLPLINKVFFYKYAQALLAMCIAVLCAMAIDNGIKARVSRVVPVTILWGLALIFFLRKVADLFEVKNLRLDYYSATNTKWALTFLLIASLICLAPKLFKRLKMSHLAIATVVLIFLEMWIHIPAGRTQRHNPYIAPPFVKYLQEQKPYFRTYATDAILWPNTNAAYGLEDIRSLNAVQPQRYMDYISNFSDLHRKGHVTGLEGVNLDSNFFDALNVEYILTLKPPTKNLDYTLEAQKIPRTKISNEVWFKAPFSVNLKVPYDTKILNLSVKSGSRQLLKIKTINNGKATAMFSKHIRAGRSKEHFSVKEIASRFIQLRFSGDVLINSLHYNNGTDLEKKFIPVFTDTAVKPAVTIYKNTSVMPRVTLYDKFKVVGENRLLDVIDSDIRKVALLEKPLQLQKDSKPLSYKANITEYQQQRIKIKVKTNKESLLVLADTYYPGWKAFVNGTQQPIVPVNYMFRGVKIGPGAKEVIFIYDADVYRYSFSFFGFAMLAMVGMVISSRLNIQIPNLKS